MVEILARNSVQARPKAAKVTDRRSPPGNPYNGYSWKQRSRPHAHTDTLRSYSQSGGPCEICAEDGPHAQLHSEDYSKPYFFCPPGTYILCNVCHQRLHKRFPDENGKASDWKVFQAHLRGGGYGREFTEYSRATRLAWQAQIDAGENVRLPVKRVRALTGHEWWQSLSLDPECLVAPWARPRPWLERPSTDDYRAALNQIRPSAVETKLLRVHANLPRRCATMRRLAELALSSDSPSPANLAYGKLAHRLAEALGTKWQPECRADGSPSWMTTIAEGWQPAGREYEWVMVPSLAKIFIADAP